MMSQQDFNLKWPLGDDGSGNKIPGAAILQERDGKDEPITLAGNMVLVGNLWVPVSAANRLPVEATLTGQSVEYEITTLMDAVSVSANASELAYVDLGGGADEIWFLINIDQQPWTFRSNSGPWSYGVATVSGPTTYVTYPSCVNRTDTASNPALPVLALWVLSSNAEYDSYKDAFVARQPGADRVRIAVTNSSESVATVTVRAYKVWRY